MKTEIKVWSKIGHTPLTARVGAYCDELVSETADCTSPADAREYVLGVMKRTPHAHKGYFIMPEWDNQNIRSQWLIISDTFKQSETQPDKATARPFKKEPGYTITWRFEGQFWIEQGRFERFELRIYTTKAPGKIGVHTKNIGRTGEFEIAASEYKEPDSTG